jgi:uncharacterized membrane protein
MMSSVEPAIVLPRSDDHSPLALRRPGVRGAQRIRGVDAARGAAMLFACLAHFGEGFFTPRHDVSSMFRLDYIGMVASPTFMLLSGAMLGLLSSQSGDKFPAIRDKLIDRGLWMLTIGHLIILCAHIALTPGWNKLWRWEFITDSIAVSIILGPLIVRRLGSRARLASALALFAASWMAVYAWHPGELWLRVIKDGLVGNDMAHGEVDVLPYNFPLCQWFAVYLGATMAGEWLAGASRRMRPEDIAWRCLQASAISLTLAIILFAAGRFGPLPIRMLTSPFQKFPPGPVYVLSYGGAGLTVAALCLLASEWPLATAAIDRLATVGRASLFVFIFQYYLYFAILYRIPVAPAWSWPGVFLLSLWLVMLAATWWDRRGYTRLLTVGYARANRR